MPDEMFNLEDLFSKDDLKMLAELVEVPTNTRMNKSELTTAIKEGNKSYITFLLNTDKTLKEAQAMRGVNILVLENFILTKSESPLEMKNIKYFSFKDGFYGIVQEPHSARIINYNGSMSRDKVTEILQEMTNDIDRSIEFYSVYSSDSCSYTGNKEKLTVFMHGSKERPIVGNMPSGGSLYGIVPTNNRTIVPTIETLKDKNYYLFFTEPEGMLAYYFSNDFSEVFIPYALNENSKDEKLFKKFLAEITITYQDFTNPETKENAFKKYKEYMEALKEKQEEKAKEFFISINDHMQKALKENLKKDLVSKEQKIKEYEKLYIDYLLKAKEISLQIQGLDLINNAKQKEKMLKDFEMLKKNKHVKRVYLSEDQQYLKVDTGDIFLYEENRKVWYYMGQFTLMVKIYKDSMSADNVQSNEAFKFKNNIFQLKGLKSNQQAPHVWGEFHACLGNVRQTLVEFLVHYDYRAVIEMMINFLKAVNVHDDAGAYVSRWPIVKEGGKLDFVRWVEDYTEWIDKEFFEAYVKDAKKVKNLSDDEEYYYGERDDEDEDYDDEF